MDREPRRHQLGLAWRELERCVDARPQVETRRAASRVLRQGTLAPDPRVEDALRAYGVMRRPELRIDPADADGPVVQSQDWVGNLSVGIEFGFQEEGAYMGLDQADRGVGPMVLTEIYLYAERPGVKPYPHPLPFGASLGDSRDATRARLDPLLPGRRSYVRDTWDTPAFRMTASYADDGARIDFLVCMLRLEDPEPFESASAPLPTTGLA